MLEHWQEGFLEVLRRTGNVKTAADRAGVHRAVAYYHRRTKREFKLAWGAAVGFYRKRRARESMRFLG